MLGNILPELSRYHLVLASGSPRRHELLAQIGVNAEIIPSQFPEDLNKTEFSSAGEYCLENSRRKVLEVLDRKRNSFDGPTIIIGSDTVVVNDGEILEKPRSPEEALEIAYISSRKNSLCYFLYCFAHFRQKECRAQNYR
ncbi:hypothetical protein DSO57_1006452 [Entomophthora muscae]|uniref:Uncharacterized protein n=1 Tax=Entomophthora muscae TaxID=34485 RepID=A0ACC2UTI1_9FUNG|nr:hypothetical protein DSO57_1006452 [Entomophthora muscae]